MARVGQWPDFLNGALFMRDRRSLRSVRARVGGGVINPVNYFERDDEWGPCRRRKVGARWRAIS